MQAHDNPVFVEDMARAAACALGWDNRLAWFRVEAANDESIHNHAAFARINSPPPRTRWQAHDRGLLSSGSCR
jgi:GTP cyclohydrolase IB